MLSAPAAIPLVSTFGLAAFLSVVGRLRIRAAARLCAADDVTITISLMVGMAMNILFCVEYNDFNNDTIWDGEMHELLYYSGNICAILSPCLTKISILIFYVRIIELANKKKVRRILIGTMILIAVYGLVFILLYALSCNPVQYYWLYVDPKYTFGVDYTCIPDMIGNAGGSIMGAITDIWVIVLPVFFLRDLAIQKRQKNGLYIMFGLGAFTSIAGLIKAGILLADGLLAMTDWAPDWLTNELDRQSIYWYILEVNGGIICACMPALKPLFNWATGNQITIWKSTKFSSKTNTTGPEIPTLVTAAAQRNRKRVLAAVAIEMGEVEESHIEAGAEEDTASHGSQTALTEYPIFKLPRVTSEEIEKVKDDAASQGSSAVDGVHYVRHA